MLGQDSVRLKTLGQVMLGSFRLVYIRSSYVRLFRLCLARSS